MEPVERARREILLPAEIDTRDVDVLLGRLAGRGVDAGELYFQAVRNESWRSRMAR